MGYKQSTMITLQDMRASGFSPRTVSVEDVSLLVTEGAHEGLALPLDRENIRIGRGKWCELILADDPQVSKEHCELEISDEGVRLRDLGSRNGIFHGGVRVFDALLAPGDSVMVGNSRILLQRHEARKEITIPFSDAQSLLVGQTPSMRRLFAQIERLAPLEVPVLLTGETGTGKSTMAQAIHYHSPRCEGPFVVVNCGALSPSLVEALLFGHEKGAFTGADKRHHGFFAQANGGTLFLDEVGELPPALQPKLLDVLERGVIQPLGREQEQTIDVRIISSTHRDLAQDVQQGRFRQDLYFRLAVVEMEIPPLRERKADIPLLVGWLLNRLDPKRQILMTDDAIEALQEYLWPGNVRQLHNVLQRALALADPEALERAGYYLDAGAFILPSMEPPGGQERRKEGATESQAPAMRDSSMPLKLFLEETEKHAIAQALDATRWNVSLAAQDLQISRAWLHRRIKKFGLVPMTYMPGG